MNHQAGVVGNDATTGAGFFVDKSGQTRSVLSGRALENVSCSICVNKKEHATYYNNKKVSDALDILSELGKYTLNL